MPTTIDLAGITVDVARKDIKNVHLSVYSPTGKVRISAPVWMSLDSIRVFAISKLGWIRKQQLKKQEQAREIPLEYLDRESHYVWGQRYLLTVIESEQPPSVELNQSHMVLNVRKRTSKAKKKAVVEEWYREQIKQAVPSLIGKWEPIIGEKVERFFVQRMKTRWGSCNPVTKGIRLNTELAKKPRECLEYVVVHEMVHFLERHHNERFMELMDRFLPRWRFYKAELNRIPNKITEDWRKIL